MTQAADPAPKIQLPAPRPDGRRTLPAIISEFQPDAVELEEKLPPRIARLALYGVTALMATAVAWASVSTIDEIVVAPGKLITTKPTIVTQPLETSIIRAIHVAVGDVVHAGDPLATLDATFTQADVDQHRTKFASLDAQVKRIESELDDVDYPATSGATSDQALQVRLFGQRRAYYDAQVQNFDQQIAGQTAALTNSRAQEEILSLRRDALTQIEAARETLYKRETGSLLNFLTSRDARLGVDATLAQIRGGRVETEHTIGKLRADRRAFIEDFRRAAMDQLVDLRGQRDASAEELKKMELRRDLITLTAPADAVVLDLAQRSIGSVVREAEPIVTLVPLNVPLEAEVSVNTRDIGHLSGGEPSRIKLDAYPFQKFGTLTGVIQTISRDAFPPDPKTQASGAAAAPFFKARILLDDAKLRRSSELHGSQEGVRLLPGMTVTAEIKVGQRKVISYFIDPLVRGLDESIREP